MKPLIFCLLTLAISHSAMAASFSADVLETSLRDESTEETAEQKLSRLSRMYNWLVNLFPEDAAKKAVVLKEIKEASLQAAPNFPHLVDYQNVTEEENRLLIQWVEASPQEYDNLKLALMDLKHKYGRR